jgi:hypothetical protein
MAVLAQGPLASQASKVRARPGKHVRLQVGGDRSGRGKLDVDIDNLVVVWLTGK